MKRISVIIKPYLKTRVLEAAQESIAQLVISREIKLCRLAGGDSRLGQIEKIVVEINVHQEQLSATVNSILDCLPEGDVSAQQIWVEEIFWNGHVKTIAEFEVVLGQVFAPLDVIRLTAILRPNHEKLIKQAVAERNCGVTVEEVMLHSRVASFDEGTSDGSPRDVDADQARDRSRTRRIARSVSGWFRTAKDDSPGRALSESEGSPARFKVEAALNLGSAAVISERVLPVLLEDGNPQALYFGRVGDAIRIRTGERGLDSICLFPLPG